MGAVAKHRAGDIDQPIADRAQGARVAVTTLSQSGVLGAAARVVLRGDARPVVKGAFWSLGLHASRRVTIRLFADRLVAGAASRCLDAERA